MNPLMPNTLVSSTTSAPIKQYNLPVKPIKQEEPKEYSNTYTKFNKRLDPIEKDFISIKDTRKIQPVTLKPINPNTDLKTGNYDYGNIQRVIGAAKFVGVPPDLALSISMTESGIGKSDDNFGHVLSNLLPNVDKKINELDEETINKYSYPALQLAYAMQEKIKDFNDLKSIQSYNGTKNLTSNTEKGMEGSGNKNGVKSWYGVDVTKQPLNAGKILPFAKTVKSIQDSVINTNPQIQQLIKNGKLKNGGWLNSYATGGVVDDPTKPFNPINNRDGYFPGMNNQTLVTDATAVKKQVLPTQKELQINKLNNAISNQPKPTVSPMKKEFISEKPSAWEQKILQKQEEANTMGLARVTFNQFGEPELEYGMVGQPGFSPPASGRVDADYMDPLTMGVTMGAGAYGKGLSLADAALVGLDAGTYGASSLGKSMGKWGTELVKGSIAAGKLKMPEFVTALRTEAAGFNPATVTPHPSLNPTQQTYTGKWIQTASGKNPGAFDEALAYVSGPERKQTGDMQLLSNVIPWSQAQKFAGKNLPFDAKTMSFGPGIHGTLENALKQKAINNREYFLLKNYNTRAEKIKQSTNLSGALDKTISRLRKDPNLFNPNEMLSTGISSSMRASPIAVGSSDIIAAEIQNLKNSALTGHITTEIQQGSKEMVKHTTGHSVLENKQTEPQKRTKIKRIGYKNGGKLNNWLNNYK